MTLLLPKYGCLLLDSWPGGECVVVPHTRGCTDSDSGLNQCVPMAPKGDDNESEDSFELEWDDAMVFTCI